MLPDHMERHASLICKPQVTSIAAKANSRKTPTPPKYTSYFPL